MEGEKGRKIERKTDTQTESREDNKRKKLHDMAGRLIFHASELKNVINACTKYMSVD